MALVRSFLDGIECLPGLGSARILAAVFALGGLGVSAALAGIWIRRYGSPKLKDAMALALFLFLSVGLFVYWPWRFAFAITLVIGVCMGADILKRNGFLRSASK